MSVEQPARFVDSGWPLLVVHLPALMNSMTAIASIVDGYEGRLRRNERFAQVVNCSAVVKFPGPAERKALVDWLGDEARKDKERRLTVATSVVLTSGPMRAILSAVNWVARPATPQKWVESEQEAIEWCCGRLVEAGLALSPGTGALRARALVSIPASRTPR
jgi:hypothetical protein